jgi:hypothetical protein
MNTRELRICLFALSVCIVPSHGVFAQSKDQQTQVRQTGVQERGRTAEATRVDHAPRLDGTLSDPLWQEATPIDNFFQREPFEGRSATEQTEVRILFTKHEVYFGITCSDSDPKGIVATELRRDVSQELDETNLSTQRIRTSDPEELAGRIDRPLVPDANSSASHSRGFHLSPLRSGFFVFIFFTVVNCLCQ